jgi:hypothetical protein
MKHVMQYQVVAVLSEINVTRERREKEGVGRKEKEKEDRLA